MSDTKERLKALIQAGKTDVAAKMIRNATGHQEAEGFVFVALQEEKSTPELVAIALETFLGTRENYHQEHGYWVHSLSHFTSILWRQRLDSWIKKFNEVAFNGANELDDPNCSSRLVNDFGEYAKWDDNPADFQLTRKNLRWMDDWKYYMYAKARIDHGPFESEEAFLRWELDTPVAYEDHHTDKVDPFEYSRIVGRLRALGVDTSEFDAREKNLLTTQLNELESKLPEAKEEWSRKGLEARIQKTRAALNGEPYEEPSHAVC